MADLKTIDYLLSQCAEASGLSEYILKQPIKKPNAVIWRNAAMLVLNEDFRVPTEKLGDFFGRCASSVRASIRKFKEDAKNDDKRKRIIHKIRSFQQKNSPPVKSINLREPVKGRKCLKCRKAFLPRYSGEYVCPNCKKSKEWRDGDVSVFKVVK